MNSGEIKKARGKLTITAFSSVGKSQARDVCMGPYSLCHVWAGSRHGRLKRNLIVKDGVRKIDNGGEKIRTRRTLTVAAFSIQLASGGGGGSNGPLFPLTTEGGC